MILPPLAAKAFKNNLLTMKDNYSEDAYFEAPHPYYLHIPIKDIFKKEGITFDHRQARSKALSEMMEDMAAAAEHTDTLKAEKNSPRASQVIPRRTQPLPRKTDEVAFSLRRKRG